MRFLYAKLVGYIGVYNGLGKSSIEIDFSKAKNKICVVSGPNGTGKSTIVNALNLMPDGNEN
jgi:ABC-type Mn2+/Zn2+ transport system ATPase subunit